MAGCLQEASRLCRTDAEPPMPAGPGGAAGKTNGWCHQEAGSLGSYPQILHLKSAPKSCPPDCPLSLPSVPPVCVCGATSILEVTEMETATFSFSS